MRRHGRHGLAKNNPTGVALRGGVHKFATKAFRFVAGSTEPSFGQRPPSLATWTSGGNVWRPVVCAAFQSFESKLGPGASIPTAQTSGPTRTGLEAVPLVGFVSVKSALQELRAWARGNTARLSTVI